MSVVVVARRLLVQAPTLLLLLSIAIAAGCSGAGDLPRDSQTVGGITIDLGVVPAALVRGHPIRAGEAGALHGGAPEGSSSHHVVVALFDAGTGARISDARVRAGVGASSYDHAPDRELEPMAVNGAMSYGGFFLMQGNGLYRIHLEILRPGATRPIEAQFVYEHAQSE
jgi:hypothetical protein